MNINRLIEQFRIKNPRENKHVKKDVFALIKNIFRTVLIYKQ